MHLIQNFERLPKSGLYNLYSHSGVIAMNVSKEDVEFLLNEERLDYIDRHLEGSSEDYGSNVRLVNAPFGRKNVPNWTVISVGGSARLSMSWIIDDRE